MSENNANSIANTATVSGTTKTVVRDIRDILKQSRGSPRVSFSHQSQMTPRNTYTDRVDIALIAMKWKENLDKLYEEDPEKMKSITFHLGKPLAIAVKEARSSNSNTHTMNLFGDTYSFPINIRPHSKLDKTDLTKARFFAIVHRYLHEAAQRETDPESKGFMCSSLVGRVEFDEENPLFPYRFLLGEGFHLNHDLFKGEDEQSLFLLGCFLLDFLSSQSRKSPRYECCKHSKTLAEYVGSGAAKRGDSLLAALRQADISLNMLDQKMPLLQERAKLFKVHPFGTSYYSIVVRRKVGKLLEKMRLDDENHPADG